MRTHASSDRGAWRTRPTQAVLALVALLSLTSPASPGDGELAGESFEVHQSGPRSYRARGSFVVEAPPAAAWEAIADYEGIPQVAPSVQVSRIVSREGNRVVVEQEASASLLFFSKRIHLLLEIEESPPSAIRFRDVARREFASYEGFWTIEEAIGGLRVSYGLDVERGFSAPDFLARKLFRQQAQSLMRIMRDDILRRAAPAVP
jgi:hypothetical protein